MTYLRTLVGTLVLVATAGCTASSSSGGVAQSTGCFAVSEALSTFQDFADGLNNKTLTESDMESDLKTIADKLNDAASIGPASIAATASSAATDAGQIRAAVANGDDPSSISATAGDLRSKMDSLSATCNG